MATSPRIVALGATNALGSIFGSARTKGSSVTRYPDFRRNFALWLRARDGFCRCQPTSTKVRGGFQPHCPIGAACQRRREGQWSERRVCSPRLVCRRQHSRSPGGSGRPGGSAKRPDVAARTCRQGRCRGTRADRPEGEATFWVRLQRSRQPERRRETTKMGREVGSWWTSSMASPGAARPACSAMLASPARIHAVLDRQRDPGDRGRRYWSR